MRDKPRLNDCGSQCVAGTFRLGSLCKKRLEGAGEGGDAGADRLKLSVGGTHSIMWLLADS